MLVFFLFIGGAVLGMGVDAVWWSLSVLIGFHSPSPDQANAVVVLSAIATTVGVGVSVWFIS